MSSPDERECDPGHYLDEHEVRIALWWWGWLSPGGWWLGGGWSSYSLRIHQQGFRLRFLVQVESWGHYTSSTTTAFLLCNDLFSDVQNEIRLLFIKPLDRFENSDIVTSSTHSCFCFHRNSKQIRSNVNVFWQQFTDTLLLCLLMICCKYWESQLNWSAVTIATWMTRISKPLYVRRLRLLIPKAPNEKETAWPLTSSNPGLGSRYQVIKFVI